MSIISPVVAATLAPQGTISPGQDSLVLAQHAVGTILTVLFDVTGILALIYVLWAGFTYASAGGDPEKAKKARATLVNAIIGIIIILATYAIIALVRRVTVITATGDNASAIVGSTAKPITTKPTPTPSGGGSLCVDGSTPGPTGFCPPGL